MKTLRKKFFISSFIKEEIIPIISPADKVIEIKKAKK
jgi:hypothetical protein